jgi:tripartite-type tricarboxylate transporter receptor subunit TctC
MPAVPTIGAAGFPGMEGEGWVGVLAATVTPKEVIALLYKQINEIITLPESKEKFSQLGLDIVGGTAEAFAKQMRMEGDKWAKLIKTANIKAK